MAEVMTVTGAADVSSLGFCQCHEHIALSKGPGFDMNAALLIDDLQKSTEEVRRFYASGGRTLVEAQPVGCNRISPWLYEISRATGVNIIASTGFHKMAFYPEDHWIHSISREDFCALLTTELTTGMYTDADLHYPETQDTPRAGLIKTAFDTEELSERYRRLFLAAADAALACNVNLMIHVEQNTDPRPLQQLLLERGLPAKRMMFCHMDRAVKDLEIHKEILRQGSYLEYDTIGRFKYHDDGTEVQIFREMISAGFERQLLYSLDTTRARLKAYDEEAVGLDYILLTFNRKLLDAGIPEEIIHLISVENPAAFFSI